MPGGRGAEHRGAVELCLTVESLPCRGISADAWNLAAPWNIAVRTRGVFTHRDDSQKPACAERGLVRTVSQPFSGKYGPCIHFWMLVFDIKDVYIGGADLASDGIVMKDAGKRGDFCPTLIK